MEDENNDIENIEEINKVANNLKPNNRITNEEFDNSFDKMKCKIDSLREKIIKNRNKQQKDFVDVQKLNNLMSQTWIGLKQNNPKLMEIKNLLGGNYLNKYNDLNTNIPKLRFHREKVNYNDYYISAISGKKLNLNNIISYSKPLKSKNNNLILSNNFNNKILFFEYNQSQTYKNLTERSLRSSLNLNKSSSVKTIKRVGSPFNKEYYRNELFRLHHKLFTEDYFSSKNIKKHSKKNQKFYN